MATIKIKSLDGADAGSLDLSDAVFGVEPSLPCIRATLHAQMAAGRAGTHATKTRGEVRGGGRKPWRQKGTGRARAGSIRSPIWRGGAVTFGPRPRSYRQKVNQKVRRKAIISVLSELAREERILAIEGFAMTEPKTQRLAEILKTLKTTGPVLIITEQKEEAVRLSARNLPFITCITADSPNVADLLSHDTIVATQGALKRLEGTYA